MSHKAKYRVYYEDTDAGGVVYHANYLGYGERARTEWLRELGFNQSELDFFFVVRKATVDYLHPAKLDDEIIIETSLQKLGGASINMKHELFVTDIKIADIEIILVTVSKESMRPVKVPHLIREKLDV